MNTKITSFRLKPKILLRVLVLMTTSASTVTKSSATMKRGMDAQNPAERALFPFEPKVRGSDDMYISYIQTLINTSYNYIFGSLYIIRSDFPFSISSIFFTSCLIAFI